MTTPPLDLLDLVDLLADFPENEFLDVPRGHLTALLARVTAAESLLARYIVERTRFGDAMAASAVAPVVDAIMRELTTDSNARATAAEAAIARVREVHVKDDRECATCRDAYGDYMHYPCPTITALDTHTPETETP